MKLFRIIVACDFENIRRVVVVELRSTTFHSVDEPFSGCSSCRSFWMGCWMIIINIDDYDCGLCVWSASVILLLATAATVFCFRVILSSRFHMFVVRCVVCTLTAYTFYCRKQPMMCCYCPLALPQAINAHTHARPKYIFALFCPTNYLKVRAVLKRRPRNVQCFNRFAIFISSK